jgi:acyl-CoA synthetase (AMP-forming)/AMP-acid ligase II
VRTPLDALLAEAVERHGDAPAVVYGGRRLTYDELDALVDSLCERLSSIVTGFVGARIAVIAPNSPLLVAAMFAAWRLGAVAVPLNERLRQHELSQILADAEPLVIVSVPDHRGFSFAELLSGLAPELPSVRGCLLLDAGCAGTVRTVSESPRVDPATLSPEIASILYTSGTTGMPKGALVTHEREVNGPRQLASVLSLGGDDCVALVIPASHAFGLTCMLAAIVGGARTVLVESTMTLGPLLDAIERERATILHGAPTLFGSLLKARPDSFDTIRAGFVGGAPSPPELQRRLDDLGILNLYGLTETGAVACCRPEDAAEVRQATAGRPLPGMETRVVDGELQVRGVGVTPGYLNRPQETAAAFHDGWFRTGDIAELEDGYVRISGRLKELVHVSGFNVFPAEVEAVLLLHPDVVQAAVVGVADDRAGEVLRAYVVRRPGSELTATALLQFARGRIAGYKLPYAIRLLPELPLLPSGKPDRRALAAR